MIIKILSPDKESAPRYSLLSLLYEIKGDEFFFQTLEVKGLKYLSYLNTIRRQEGLTTAIKVALYRTFPL